MSKEVIPPSERRELRAVVRQQIKVLRTEVKQRKAELMAEAEARLLEKYRDEDREFEEIGRELGRITTEANRQLEEMLEQHKDAGLVTRGYGTRFEAPRLFRAGNERQQLHKAMETGVDAQVQNALLALDRQEADLLRVLALESLETETAKEFLNRIPSVAELVPSKRLREIEAQFDAQAPN